MSYVIRAGCAGRDSRYLAGGREPDDWYWSQDPRYAWSMDDLSRVRDRVDTIMDDENQIDLSMLALANGRANEREVMIVIEIFKLDEIAVVMKPYDRHVVRYSRPRSERIR